MASCCQGRFVTPVHSGIFYGKIEKSKLRIELNVLDGFVGDQDCKNKQWLFPSREQSPASPQPRPPISSGVLGLFAGKEGDLFIVRMLFMHILFNLTFENPVTAKPLRLHNGNGNEEADTTGVRKNPVFQKNYWRIVASKSLHQNTTAKYCAGDSRPSSHLNKSLRGFILMLGNGKTNLGYSGKPRKQFKGHWCIRLQGVGKRPSQGLLHFSSNVQMFPTQCKWNILYSYVFLTSSSEEEKQWLVQYLKRC